MKTKRFLFLALLLSSIACNKEDLQHPILDCIRATVDPYDEITCDFRFWSNYYCDVELFGHLRLMDESKLFLPQYCHEIGDEIDYENESGEFLKFQIVYKNAGNISGTVNTGERCPGDPTMYKGECYTTDYIQLNLESSDHDIKFSVYIRCTPNYNLDGSFGDYLYISRRKDSTHFETSLRIIVNQRNLKEDKLPGQKYFPTIELNGKQFLDVNTSEPAPNLDEAFKCYYNTSKGLVGFEDSNDILWTLKE